MSSPEDLWLRTAAVEVALRPARGADILALQRPGGRNALAHYDWQTPQRSSSGTGYGDSTLDWLSEYRGGWQTLFPNAGAECVHHGVQLPFHGEASAAAWTVLEQERDRALLEVPCRLPLVLRREVRLGHGQATLFIEELAVNQSDADQQVIWVQHPAFDLPDGTRIDLPSASVHVDPAGSPALDVHQDSAWPRAFGRDGSEVDLGVVPPERSERLCYITDLSEGWAAARCLDRLGIAMAWPLDVYPHLWLWQQIGGPAFPWYGRSSITALEPASAWPADGLAAAVERGQALTIPAGGSLGSWLTLTLFDANESAVHGVGRDGTVRLNAREA